MDTRHTSAQVGTAPGTEGRGGGLVPAAIHVCSSAKDARMGRGEGASGG